MVAETQLRSHTHVGSLVVHFTRGLYGSWRQLKNPVAQLNTENSDVANVSSAERFFTSKIKYKFKQIIRFFGSVKT